MFHHLGGSDRSSAPRGDGDRESYRRDGAGGAPDKGGAGENFEPKFVSATEFLQFHKPCNC